MKKRFKRMAFLTAVTIVSAGSLQLIAHVAAPGNFELISSAEAVVAVAPQPAPDVVVPITTAAEPPGVEVPWEAEPLTREPLWAPVPEPSIKAGVTTLTACVLELMGKQDK